MPFYPSIVPSPGDLIETLVGKIAQVTGAEVSPCMGYREALAKILAQESFAAPPQQGDTSYHLIWKMLLGVAGGIPSCGSPDYTVIRANNQPDEYVGRTMWPAFNGSAVKNALHLFVNVKYLQQFVVTAAGRATILEVSFPNLIAAGYEISGVVGGVFLDTFSVLTTVNFPELVYTSGWSFGVVNCPKLTTINLPKYQGSGSTGTGTAIAIQSNAILASVSLPSYVRSGGINIYGNPQLTAINIPNLASVAFSSAIINLSGNALPQAMVDSLLIAGAANLSIAAYGIFDVSGGTNATPSAAGLAAKATMVARGVLVTTN